MVFMSLLRVQAFNILTTLVACIPCTLNEFTGKININVAPLLRLKLDNLVM